MVTKMQRGNSEIAYILWTVGRNKIYQESLTILVGLAISCLKLILLNNDLSCFLSGLLRLDDKAAIKVAVKNCFFSFDCSTSQNIVYYHLVL